MATLNVTNVFAPSTLAEASEVNQNMDEIEAFVNTQVMHRDASSAFTAVPSGPSSDPVSGNQLTRKAYVDVPFGYSTISANLANTAAPGTNAVGANWVNVQARGITGSTSGFTIITTRLYLVGGATAYGTSGAGTRRQFAIQNNGATINGLVSFEAPSGVSTPLGLGLGPGVRPIALTAGDVITGVYNQDSGGALAFNGAIWIMAVPGL